MIAFAWLLALSSGMAASSQDSSSLADAKTPAAPTATAAGFLYKTLDFQGAAYAYCVFVPPEYKPDQRWPVILFLHGSGERGSDGFLQSEVGIGTAIRRNRALCPAVVVMPQCRNGASWDGPMVEMALKCVEKSAQEYNLDPDRLYLTGLSLGGAGAWQIAGRYPDQFAAVAPICGFLGRPDLPFDPQTLKNFAARLTNVPVWCYHGTADNAVKVQRSQEIIAAIRAAGGSPKYTEVPEAGHNVWDQAYANPELWKWMLSQKRAKRDPNAG